LRTLERLWPAAQRRRAIREAQEAAGAGIEVSFAVKASVNADWLLKYFSEDNPNLKLGFRAHVAAKPLQHYLSATMQLDHLTEAVVTTWSLGKGCNLDNFIANCQGVPDRCASFI